MNDVILMALLFGGGVLLAGWFIYRRELGRRELSGFLSGTDTVPVEIPEAQNVNSIHVWFSKAGYPDWGEIHALMALVLSGAAGFLFGLLITGTLLGAAGFIIAGPFILYSFLARNIEKNEIGMYKQMGDFCTRLANSIISGNTLEQAIASVAPKLDEPLCGPIKEMARKISQGNVKLLDAIQETSAYLPVTSYRMFMVAVRTHYRLGGDLAQSLLNIAAQVEESNKAIEDIKTHNQDAVMEGIIITLFPVGILIAERIFIPDYLSIMFTTTQGLKYFSIALALIAGAWVFIRKITKIKVL